MISIFVNNYRSLEKSFIDLGDVSFFVGENSTGKTSVINLIHNFSLLDFWMRGIPSTDPGVDEVFDDICIDGSSFQIGIMSDGEDEVDTKISLAFFEYIKDGGRIKLQRFNYYDQSIKKMICLTLVKDMVYYKASLYKSYKKTKSSRGKGNIISRLKDITTVWSSENVGSRKGYKKTKFERHGGEENDMFSLMYKINSLISKKETDSPFFFFPRGIFEGRTMSIDPVRMKPQRMYENKRSTFSSDGEHTPNRLFNIMKKQTSVNNYKELVKRLKMFGAKSNLFDNIQVKLFGSDSDSPFTIKIGMGSKKLKLPYVGYGVSQILPIIVDMLNRGRFWFLIQQPEVHLHPKAQADFGDFLYEIASEKDKKFVIETHSDYLINRYRLNLKNNSSYKPRSSVLFFRRHGNKNTIVSIPIDENGEYPSDKPKEFRQFFIDEELKILGY